MYKNVLLMFFLTLFVFAENNATDKNVTKEANTTDLTNKNLQKAIEAEKKFEKEQKFYQGDDYNLTEHEVDEKSVEKVPVIEPEYDFDITDLYAD
jgi:hypothetical protein